MEEERAERQRWNEREHQRIMNSVKGTARLEMLNLHCMAAPTIPLSLSLFFPLSPGLARIRRQAIASRQQASGGDGDDIEEPASESDSEVSQLSLSLSLSLCM